MRKALVKSDKVAISNIETSNIDDVVRRAHTGDEVAVRALRHTFDASPDLWRFAGDLAVQSEQTWTALASSGHPIMKEAVSRHLATLRQELAGQSNGHVFEHADRRPARADETFRRRAWQSVANANGDRAPASWPRER